MYKPSAFFTRDPEAESVRLAGAHPFATVVTIAGGETFVDHVPLLVEFGREGRPHVAGHFSRQNPHAAAMGRAGQTLAIFQGPNAYVSPRWYDVYDVPTWNYAVAHMRGAVRLIEDERSLVALVGRLSAHFEQPLGGLAGPLIPQDLRAPGELAAAIVGFELFDLEISVKMKLSQNRSTADQRGVVEGLEAVGDAGSRQTAALMRRINGL